MAKEPTYTKDPYTGAVVFTDVDAYAQRKKVIQRQKLSEKTKKDSKRSINSMRNEIKSLKKLVSDFIEGGKN
tara:strand:+ start:384 stop:599 length:216 start_codon:yes stop_codon:yes gene_type:complete